MIDKDLNTKAKAKIVLGIISLFFLAGTLYIKSCFSQDASLTPIQSVPTQKIDTFSKGPITNNIQTKVGRDQNNAGRDIKTDNRKVDVHGPAFFDSSKQINNYNYTNVLKQRHIDLKIMRRIIEVFHLKTQKSKSNVVAMAKVKT